MVPDRPRSAHEAGRETPAAGTHAPVDLVDEWGRGSFPASDPQSAWGDATTPGRPIWVFGMRPALVLWRLV